jgi:hypothetical protein
MGFPGSSSSGLAPITFEELAAKRLRYHRDMAQAIFTGAVPRVDLLDITRAKVEYFEEMIEIGFKFSALKPNGLGRSHGSSFRPCKAEAVRRSVGKTERLFKPFALPRRF